MSFSVFRDGMDFDTWLKEQNDRSLLEYAVKELVKLRNEHDERVAAGASCTVVNNGFMPRGLAGWQRFLGPGGWAFGLVMAGYVIGALQGWWSFTRL